MNKLIVVDLAGQPRPFRLHEDAYDSLAAYLDHARARLGGDPGADEVVGDLERSIGDRLAGRTHGEDLVLDAAAVRAVLDEVGVVDVGDAAPRPSPTSDAAPRPAGRRRLVRIKEGQEIAGVCSGLAAYSDVRVDWVRTIFVLLALVTAGIFVLVYIVMMFVLPTVETREAWLASIEAHAA